MYFFFGGFHLLFSLYMCALPHTRPSRLTPSSRIIGIPSTGSAGLIQTIQMFSQGHWAAGILGAIATIGWSLQGVGNAFYYRQVCPVSAATPPTTKQFPDLVSSHSRWPHHGQGESSSIQTQAPLTSLRQRRNWRAMVPRHTLLGADLAILTSLHACTRTASNRTPRQCLLLFFSGHTPSSTLLVGH